MSRRRGAAILLGALCAAIAAAAVTFSRGRGAARELTVTVGGKPVVLADGTTLGEAVSLLRLHPRPGNLLAVDGSILDRGVAPGAVLVDGHAVPRAARLQNGDRISLLAGRDEREPLVRRLVPLPRGVAADPEFSLARTPGEELLVRGAISGGFVSSRFVPAHRRTLVTRGVALTFDDGPSPRYTPQVLRTLERLHVRATFFVIGYLADDFPSLVRQEVRGGMTVGNHSYNHPEVPAFDQLPPRLLEDEIALGAQSIRRAGGDPKLFRPPGGSFSPRVVRAAEALGERIVLWTVDPGDWRPQATAAQITRAVLSAVQPGSIVVLHDGGGDRSATVAALPLIVRGIERRGLHLVPIAAG